MIKIVFLFLQRSIKNNFFPLLWTQILFFKNRKEDFIKEERDFLFLFL